MEDDADGALTSGVEFHPEWMLHPGGIDAEEFATALSDQTEYELPATLGRHGGGSYLAKGLADVCQQCRLLACSVRRDGPDLLQ